MCDSDSGFPGCGLFGFLSHLFQKSYVSGLTLIMLLSITVFFPAGCRNAMRESNAAAGKTIVTSDTILSGMVLSLLPSGYAAVSAILPPDQCPGHYDMKLSDIKMVEDADLVVSFRDLPFMKKAADNPSKCILLDRQNRNWMAPDSYIFGLNIIAGELVERFPEIESQIKYRCEHTIHEVAQKAEALGSAIRQAGIAQQPVLASAMQREPLEWMGFKVLGDYGRPESMSVKDVIQLTRTGKQAAAALVVDNLQSGPEAGRGIADALGVPHVVLSNFPSDEGYTATLEANVAEVLAAVKIK